MESKDLPHRAAMHVLPGAVDTHVHVFDPRRFPFVERRTYTPGSALAQQLRRQHAELGISCAVLIQPSVYGTDNRCLLDAMAQYGSAKARGIAVLDLADTNEDLLDDLHEKGVRGVRLNLEVAHQNDPNALALQLTQAAAAVTRRGWNVQLHVAAPLLPVVERVQDAFRVPLVLDHFGGLRVSSQGTNPELVQCLIRLLRGGQVYVKLSAFYRASTADPHHADLAEVVRLLAATRGDRLLWGSDWPHTGGGSGPRDPRQIEPFRQVDIAASLTALRSWLPDDATWQQILRDNPSRLYGFTTDEPTPPQETT